MLTDLRQIENFGQILRNTAERYPEKTALVCGDKQCTYCQLEETSNRVASALAAEGIGVGDKVGILSSNCIDYLAIVFGCAKLGAVVVKLNWRLAPEELKYLIDLNEIKFLFYRYTNEKWHAQLHAMLFKDGKSDISFVSMDETEKSQVHFTQFIQQGRPEWEICFKGGDGVLMHLHTSGASGKPKTVVYSHRRFIDQIDACVDGLSFYHDLVFLSMSQMFHSASSGLYSCIAVGATAVIFSQFDPQKYLKAVADQHINRISAIPTVLHSLLSQPNFDDFDLNAVHTIGYSAAPMSPALIDEAIKRIDCGFMQSYGMTETGSIVTILQPEDHIKDNYKHLYSVGKPIKGVAIRIVDENGNDCPTGQSGQIVIKGPGLMLEYYKQPEKTAEVLRDGWYYSDDLGYLDEDGFLTLNGRKNDLIITGGENVFAKEVENILTKMDEVKECCVFGTPDQYWGEMVTACIVRESGTKFTEKQIHDFCHNKIAGYKVPKKVIIVDELPHNTVGKLDKPKIVSMYAKPADR